MLDARKIFYLVTLRNSIEDQNNNSLFLTNSKGGKKKLLVHFTTTTHDSKMIQKCRQKPGEGKG